MLFLWQNANDGIGFLGGFYINVQFKLLYVGWLTSFQTCGSVALVAYVESKVSPKKKQSTLNEAKLFIF